MDYEMEEKLTRIGELAEEYGKLANKAYNTDDDRVRMKQIASEVTKATPIEVAHFCYQAITWVSPGREHATLCVLTNRMIDHMEG